MVRIQLITKDPKNCPGPLSTQFRTNLLVGQQNDCGLACILGPISSLNQASLTTKKRSAYGMVAPHSGRKGTKSP